ncbi:MAG: DUF3035 domain-containing protein [Hyphomicrobiales bacterium]
MRQKFAHLLIVGCSAAFLGACSSIPDVEDVMGLSKSTPDEREVPVHQMLAMPPDYQLRPPADGSSPKTAETNPYALPALKSGGTPTVTEPSQVAAADPNAPGPQAIGPAQSDPNVVNGVSTVNADGTKKSKRQITEELKKKQIEQKRKKNANYGTIWNIGSLFEDW